LEIERRQAREGNAKANDKGDKKRDGRDSGGADDA